MGHCQMGLHPTCKTKKSFEHQSVFAKSAGTTSVTANTVHGSCQGLVGFASDGHEYHLIACHLRMRTDARMLPTEDSADCH